MPTKVKKFLSSQDFVCSFSNFDYVQLPNLMPLFQTRMAHTHFPRPTCAPYGADLPYFFENVAVIRPQGQGKLVRIAGSCGNHSH